MTAASLNVLKLLEMSLGFQRVLEDQMRNVWVSEETDPF